MSEKIFYRQERALSSHFPRCHGVHGAIFSDFSAVCKKKLTQGALPLDPSRDAVPAPCKGVPPLTLPRDWVDFSFILLSRVYTQGFRLCNEKVKPYRCSVKEMHWGQHHCHWSYPQFIHFSSTNHPQIIHRYTALSPAPADEKRGENAFFGTLSSAGSGHAIWDKHQRTFMHRNE